MRTIVGLCNGFHEAKLDCYIPFTTNNSSFIKLAPTLKTSILDVALPLPRLSNSPQ